MLKHRMITRDYLLYVDKPRFMDILYFSKVLPRQKEILINRFLDDKSRTAISLDDDVSVDTVGKDIGKAYDQIYCYVRRLDDFKSKEFKEFTRLRRRKRK